ASAIPDGPLIGREFDAAIQLAKPRTGQVDLQKDALGQGSRVDRPRDAVRAACAASHGGELLLGDHRYGRSAAPPVHLRRPANAQQAPGMVARVQAVLESPREARVPGDD